MKIKISCGKHLFLSFSIISVLLCFYNIGSNKKLHPASTFKFGIIADCQYCNAAAKGQRKYSQSDQKLHSCVSDLNTRDLSWVIHLGDFIDKDWESFDIVGPIYDQLNVPGYHVLGNHDYSVADSLKELVMAKLGLAAPYYHFHSNGWRFIILDGNDISFHAYPEGSKQYMAAEAYYIEHNISSPKWNGAIGLEQMTWLEETLRDAEARGEHVILFCHFPVYPEDVHNLWNADQVVDLIEKFPSVKAYINGHNHEGNYALKNGVHYLTMKGMVDTDTTSYGVMNIRKKRMVLTGMGREGDRVLKISRR